MKLYLVGMTLAISTILASDQALPVVAVIGLAMLAPIGPVVVGYLLTSRKLKAQDIKVQEVHLLVNSRLSKTLDALADSLTENLKLKDRLDMPVTISERLAPESVRSEGLPAETLA